MVKVENHCIKKTCAVGYKPNGKNCTRICKSSFQKYDKTTRTCKYFKCPSGYFLKKGACFHACKKNFRQIDGKCV